MTVYTDYIIMYCNKKRTGSLSAYFCIPVGFYENVFVKYFIMIFKTMGIPIGVSAFTLHTLLLCYFVTRIYRLFG